MHFRDFFLLVYLDFSIMDSGGGGMQVGVPFIASTEATGNGRQLCNTQQREKRPSPRLRL